MSNLKIVVEKLNRRGMDESTIKSFLTKIFKSLKQKDLNKLTNDPEYQSILKKYNIKPVNYSKNYDLSDLPAFRKK